MLDLKDNQDALKPRDEKDSQHGCPDDSDRCTQANANDRLPFGRKPVRWDENKKYGKPNHSHHSPIPAKQTLSSTPKVSDTNPAPEPHYYTLVLSRNDKLRQKILLALAANGHLTRSLAHEAEAIELLQEETPQLLVLAIDQNLLDFSDFFCNWRQQAETPLAVLGVLPDSETDLTRRIPSRLVDDILTEDQLLDGPFLSRRLEQLMTTPNSRKRNDLPEEGVLQVGPIRLTPEKYEVTIHGQPIQLTLTQFRLLLILSRRPGWVYSSEQISHQLKQFSIGADSGSVKTHIYLLRKRLGQAGRLIETVRGMGYRISSSVS